MKIAVLIAGEYREFPVAHKFWTFLNWPDVDIYFSTWMQSYAKTEDSDSESICEIIKPNDITDYINPVNFEIADRNLTNWNNPSGYMIDRWKSSLSLLKNSGKHYDIVILIRPDIALDYDENLFKEFVYNLPNNDNDLYGIIGGYLNTAFPLGTVGKMSDLMLIGTQNSLYKLLELPDAELACSLMDRGPDIHAYLAKYCSELYERFMNIPIPRQCIVRHNCRGLSNLPFKECKEKSRDWWERRHRAFYHMGENTWDNSSYVKPVLKQFRSDSINLWDRYDLDLWAETYTSGYNWKSPDTKEFYDRNISLKKNENHVTYGENDILYTHNTRGFRVSEFGPREYEDAGNYPTILLGGCSQTEGTGLPEHHIWHSFLTRKLTNHTKLPIAKFNLGKGGISTDTALRYAYVAIENHNLRPDMVYFFLPPVSRQEILYTHDNNKGMVYHYIPGQPIPDTIPESLKEVIKRRDLELNYRQWYHECFKSLLLMKWFLESKGIPWFFSFWVNDFRQDIIKNIVPIDNLEDCNFPKELKKHYINVNVRLDKFIDYELPFKETIARDFAHWGPNTHYDMAEQIYSSLLEHTEFKKVIEKWQM